MKKIMVILIILLVMPVCVLAATTPQVLTLTADSSKKDIYYKGTIEENSYAVMCKLYNDKDEEIDMLSSAVDEGKFEGNFTVEENGNYKVACANYEGGEIKTVDVKVDGVEKESNPKTGDAIGLYVLIFSISFLCLLTFIYRRKIANER